MPEPATSTVEVNGFSCRVWRKGSGPTLGFLAGFGRRCCSGNVHGACDSPAASGPVQEFGTVRPVS